MPKTPPKQDQLAINDIRLTYFEWGAEYQGSAPTVLLAHATGFHARCWDQVVHRLGEQHVIALDQRGHGRTEAGAIATHWSLFGNDLQALIETLDLADIIGVGHSMGGHAMTQAAAHLNERFQHLVLIDPVIGPPGYYNGEIAPRWERFEKDQHPVAKRRNNWASPDEMYERFSQRAPFSLWMPEILRDYCEYGLLPNPVGEGYILGCSPEFEASVYMANFTNSAIYEYVRKIELPVMILRAMLAPEGQTQMDFSFSPTWPELVNQYKNAQELYLPDKTHFIPMQDPDLVAKHILNQT